jgi:sterol desaturase/sphingolipid hydroxylase (fatty acid hydroxylase superfamily)
MNWRNEVYLLTLIGVHNVQNEDSLPSELGRKNWKSFIQSVWSLQLNFFFFYTAAWSRQRPLSCWSWHGRNEFRLLIKRRNSGNLPLAGPLPRGSIDSPTFGYFNPQWPAFLFLGIIFYYDVVLYIASEVFHCRITYHLNIVYMSSCQNEDYRVK